MTQAISLINDEKKMQLLKDTFFKGATNDEFQLFVHACERAGLDPFMKQIYPVKRWDSTLKREAMTIQVGIDGYRLIAERSGRYAPGGETKFVYTPEGQLHSATAYVKKLTSDGIWHEVGATALYEEYCQRTKEGNPTSMWAKMKHSQLAKCAEALALRKAFPAELSGLYTHEEMHQAEVSHEIAAPKVEATVTKQQAKEIVDLLYKCEISYADSVMAHLKKSVPGFTDDLEQLPASMFERVKLAAIKKAAEYQKYLQEEETVELEA